MIQYILLALNIINNTVRLVVDNSIDTLNYKMSDRDILIHKVRNIIKSNLDKI